MISKILKVVMGLLILSKCGGPTSRKLILVYHQLINSLVPRGKAGNVSAILVFWVDSYYLTIRWCCNRIQFLYCAEV